MAKSLLCAMVWCALISAAPESQEAVRLLTTVPSPQPVGTAISFMPHIENMTEGMHVFRYSIGVDGGPMRIIRDFSQQPDFLWSPAPREQEAKIRVTVRNNRTKETSQAETDFRIASRVKGTTATIVQTTHPLIALFSAPACAEGSNFRVAFRRAGTETVSHTNAEPCRASRSANVYVAGMRADTDYQLRSEILNGSAVDAGAWMPWHTGLLGGGLPPVSVVVPRAAGTPAPEPIVISSTTHLAGPSQPFATDLEGNVVWYLTSPDFLMRVLPGGRFLVHAEGMNSANNIRRWQVLREVDLTGGVIRETNVSRVAEQLESKGIRSECVDGGTQCAGGFHHEAIRLPNGHTMVIAGLERMFPAGTLGAKEQVDILGDLVIDLDEEFQVTAVWNAFDHMDFKQPSLESGTCKQGPGGAGCPAVFLRPEAKEWLHSNSLNYIPATGDFLISTPMQGWIQKIDWKNGKGTGKVVWRLGKDGDFTTKANDPQPWFGGGQHDAGFDPPGSNLVSVLNNGWMKEGKKVNTRGQVWQIDESTHTATLVRNADLGVFSFAVGSAQTLSNGGYTFEAGFLSASSPYGRAVETSADGKVVYAQEVEGRIVYRSFRVADLYSAPQK